MKSESKRIIKPISFADNEWERGLLEYAEDARHGGFGPYVKRLIAKDRDGWSAPSYAPVTETVSAEDAEAANGFL